jgi:hypothetical protein
MIPMARRNTEERFGKNSHGGDLKYGNDGAKKVLGRAIRKIAFEGAAEAAAEEAAIAGLAKKQTPLKKAAKKKAQSAVHKGGTAKASGLVQRSSTPKATPVPELTGKTTKKKTRKA